MKYPDRYKALFLTSALIGSAGGVAIALSENSSNPTRHPATRSIPTKPHERGTYVDTPEGRIFVPKLPPRKLPTTIPKNRFNLAPTLEPKDPGSETRFPVVTNSQLLNVDLPGAARETAKEIHDLKTAGIKCDSHTPLTVPGEPVYTYDTDGQPIRLTLGYIPGSQYIEGSAGLDMPEGADPETSRFYGYFKGHLRELINSPDQSMVAEDPGAIRLQLPSGVNATNTPTC